MFFLIYRSVANLSIGKSEVLDIWEESKNFNRTQNITGCLLYYNHEFVQYLEGEESVVEHLFGKIKMDWRHTKVCLLSSGHVNSREFEDWSMAFEDFTGPNYRLEYLKLLVSAYFEETASFKNLNPKTNKFWVVVRTLLATQAVEKFK